MNAIGKIVVRDAKKVLKAAWAAQEEWVPPAEQGWVGLVDVLVTMIEELVVYIEEVTGDETVR